MRRSVKAACLLVAIACALGCSKTPRDRIAANDAADAADAADDAIVVAVPESGEPVMLDGHPVAAGTLVAAFRAARAGTVRIEGPTRMEWRRAVGVLDQMKQAGGGYRTFVLGITGDRNRRSSPLRLPRAMSSVPPVHDPDAAAEVASENVTFVSIQKDGGIMLNGDPLKADLPSALARLSPPLREQQVTIQGDAQAPYGAIVDATVVAQRQGGRVAFGVGMSAPPER